MNWRDVSPEGSTVIVGDVRFLARHNEHLRAIDLFDDDGFLVMTIAAEFLPKIASAIIFPRHVMPGEAA